MASIPAKATPDSYGIRGITDPKKPHPQQRRPDEIAASLSETRQRAFETGLMAYHEIATEAEQLKVTLAEKNNNIHELKVELEGRDKEISQWRERCQAMQGDRDRAVQEHAVLWTLLCQVRGTLEQAGVTFSDTNTSKPHPVSDDVDDGRDHER